jgi:oligopeptide/dipeptide ABC transporter ATP-binding protein
LSNSLLEVENLVKHFPLPHSLYDRARGKTAGSIHAVDDVSFAIAKNETLGLVGESGSGKTTLGRAILMLEKPTSGRVIFQGQSISELKDDEMRPLRRKMQIVFQNPYSSLDPRARIKDIVAEPLRAFKDLNQDDREKAVMRAIAAVNLSPDSLTRFPHEFSGGQRQRIAIARALILEPEFIVLDEPTSALDSSVQAQILNLLRTLQEEMGLSYLLITHNVNVVKYMANRITVMYAGRLVEVGNTRDVLEHPLHPYTSALISSVPQPDPNRRMQTVAPIGEVPSMVNLPKGCRFNPRCPYAEEVCRNDEPPLRSILPSHYASCHFAEKFVSGSENN